jgi:hypothetical protein
LLQQEKEDNNFKPHAPVQNEKSETLVKMASGTKVSQPPHVTEFLSLPATTD